MNPWLPWTTTQITKCFFYPPQPRGLVASSPFRPGSFDFEGELVEAVHADGVERPVLDSWLCIMGSQI